MVTLHTFISLILGVGLFVWMKKLVKKVAREKHTNILYLTLALLLIWSKWSLQLPVFPGLYVQSPAMVCLHTSPSNDPPLLGSLGTQDLWREATGPQKAQVVRPEPRQSRDLYGIWSLWTATQASAPRAGLQVTMGVPWAACHSESTEVD